MSFKMYDGLRVPDMSLRELQAWCLGLQRPAIEEAQRHVIEFAQNLSEHSGLPVSKVLAEVSRIQREVIKGGRSDPADLTLELLFIPAKDKILAIPYTGSRVMREWLLKQEGVRPWGYWNNTDPDEGCSPDEWEEREADWTGAFAANSTPASIGFNITIVSWWNLDPGCIGLPRFTEKTHGEA